MTPYCTAPVKTESESSGEETSSGKATVEFLFQLGAEYLAKLVASVEKGTAGDVSSQTTLNKMISYISNKRAFPNTEMRVAYTTIESCGVFFDERRGVWKCGQSLS